MAGKFKTEAIVLRSIRYGEADRILHLYSASRGRIGAIAKGVRKPRSRFGGRLEPFFRLDLILHQGRGDLSTVTAAHTVAAHPNLRADGAALGAAARACDAVLRLCDTEESNLAAYNLLCRYLAILDGAESVDGRRQRRRRRRPRHGARLPAEAGVGDRVRARARLVRALRRGGRAGRLLRRCGRRGLRLV